jgi:hypothetical protein
MVLNVLSQPILNKVTLLGSNMNKRVGRIRFQLNLMDKPSFFGSSRRCHRIRLRMMHNTHPVRAAATATANVIRKVCDGKKPLNPPKQSK